MNNSTGNFTTSEASTNSTTQSFWLVNRLDIFLYSINLLFGLPTHSYVIWLIITGSGVASEFFNLNLSVCELGSSLNCLFCILDWFSHLKTLTYLLLGLGITGRPVFQCLMCVERYLAVVHPVTFLKYKPLRYRVICCTVAWIITLGSCFYSFFIEISQNSHMLPWFFLLQFLLFFSVQLFCLVAVLRALKQSGPGERGREREEENHMKRRAFDLILITTVSMIIIYMPFIISGFCFILMQHFIKELFSFGFIFYILAGFVQPVLYLRRTGKLSCLCSPSIVQ
ncbi:G-protein coupled receptor 35-like [Rhinichthys klamathensis goyatoka]|uniref:G-protein coupled receptor 35-like n=1 Tax=Rhinichthys klamathensis goyatoka TaxID=3034132 RepID=UPI0024B57E09|nr:G-protein coupled receptor 35-like [Rhinichthys klamathensis goyatoka]